MAHQVLESDSSVVRMIIGRVIVQRWMMAHRIRRNGTLEPTHMVRGPATILTNLVMKSVPQARFRWILCLVLRFLLSKTTMSVKTRAAFLVESEKRNSLMTMSLMSSFMYKRGSNPGDHCFLVPRLISGLTGRAREHLRMAGDLDRFAVDGGLEQFLEYLKTKWVFVDHRKREWHSRSTSTRSNVREVSP